MKISSPDPQTSSPLRWWFRIVVTFVGAIALGGPVLTGCSVSTEFGLHGPAQDIQSRAIVAYKVVTPEAAGGLQRDDADRTKSADVIGRAKQTWSQQPADRLIDKNSLVYAVYLAQDTSPPIGYLFTGGTVKDPQGVLAVLGNGGTASNIDPGPAGGQGVCTESAGVPACGWVDDHTFGYLYPLFPLDGPSAAPSVKELSELMRRMRPDLELACRAATVAQCR